MSNLMEIVLEVGLDLLEIVEEVWQHKERKKRETAKLKEKFKIKNKKDAK